MKKRITVFMVLVLALANSSVWADTLASRILADTGVKGGLVVHVGCGDGKLTAALRVNERYLVQGLDKDAGNVQKARETIRGLGVYGSVSADTFDGKHLPYADDMVNLLIADSLGKVSKSEVMRVLAPLGVALIGGKKTTKPWPDDIDEWTHFLHDASNNAVANDSRVGTPRRLRWVDGALWTRSHEFNSSLCAMVSAKGRLFYIFDEGQTGITSDDMPERWTLIARDAFNGLVLWKHSVPKWGSKQWKKTALRSIPPTVHRRLVAEGDRVFMTLGYDAPVSVMDAATGEILSTYEGTEGTEEMRCLDGVLLLRKGKDLVMAIDTENGKKLWEFVGGIQSLSLAAQDGRVFFQSGKEVLCLDMREGTELWRAPAESAVSLLLVHDDRVVLAGKNQMQAISVGTGKSLWKVNEGGSRVEYFVASNKLWNWEGDNIVGRDLSTGKVTERPNTDDVFTPGHHLRCYQSKATENFLITPNRGAEFVSLTGGENTQNDWLRGPCRYGIMPCNGLLYAPPDPCFCYQRVKLLGFNALAPAGDIPKAYSKVRLEKGAAYGQMAKASASSGKADWPTYRHDSARSGSTTHALPAKVSEQWRTNLGGKLTPPVLVGDKVYVAAKDEHTLYALNVKDGLQAWHFMAGGRIDSPPTIFDGLVLFGCADGRMYCLRASDGELIWRFRAAPSEQQIVAFGQLESPWRVHGSVLIVDGVVYCTAGRSTNLDGGISVFGLDPKTGKLLHERQLDTWARTRVDAEHKPFVAGYHMEGGLSDVLVSDGDHIYLGQYQLDRELVEQEAPYGMHDPEKKVAAMDTLNEPYVAADLEPERDYEDHQRQYVIRTQSEIVDALVSEHGGYNLGDRKMGRHVFATGGFLDDSYFNRTFWMNSETWPGFYLGHRGAKTGQLLVVGPEKTYAVQGFPSRNLQSPLFFPGKDGYLLYADDNDNEPILDDITRGTTKGWGFGRKEAPVWHDWVSVRIRGMVLAGKHLFVAGPPDVVDPDDPMAAFEGRKGGILLTVSAKDGKTLGKYELDSPPVFDGVIAAKGSLFMSTVDGKVVCLN